MPSFVIISGPDGCEGERLTLGDMNKGRVILGRTDDAVQIPDTKVSREHAEVFLDQGKWFIRDLGSRNGTFVGQAQEMARQA